MLVDASIATQHMQDTIDSDANNIIGFNQLRTNESEIHTLSTVGTGFLKLKCRQVPVLMCLVVSCP